MMKKFFRRRPYWLALALLFWLLVSLRQPVAKALPAGIIFVTTTDTDINFDFLCSLVEAIISANSDSAFAGCLSGMGADTIILGSGNIYSLDVVNNFTDGPNGLPSITSDINIEGNGSTITRAPFLPPSLYIPFRIFHVASGASLTLNYLYVLEGGAFDPAGGNGNNGGGIFNRGTVTLENSFVSKHVAAANGGGIYNLGVLTGTNSVVSGNEAGFSGGGIHNAVRGEIELITSAIRNNTASGENGAGGGINNEKEAVVYLSRSSVTGNAAYRGGGMNNTAGVVGLANSTISSNSASDSGGGLSNNSNEGAVDLINVTVAKNQAQSGSGSGLANLPAGTVKLTNTIVAENLLAPDCDGPVISLDHNLDGDGSCSLTEPNDIPSGVADLGPLLSTGGQTKTHALGNASEALDAANTAYCAAAPVSGVDQRGFPRPATVCDIGAYERPLVIIFTPIVFGSLYGT